MTINKYLYARPTPGHDLMLMGAVKTFVSECTWLPVLLSLGGNDRLEMHAANLNPSVAPRGFAVARIGNAHGTDYSLADASAVIMTRYVDVNVRFYGLDAEANQHAFLVSANLQDNWERFLADGDMRIRSAVSEPVTSRQMKRDPAGLPYRDAVALTIAQEVRLEIVDPNKQGLQS